MLPGHLINRLCYTILYYTFICLQDDFQSIYVYNRPSEYGILQTEMCCKYSLMYVNEELMHPACRGTLILQKYTSHAKILSGSGGHMKQVAHWEAHIC